MTDPSITPSGDLFHEDTVPAGLIGPPRIGIIGVGNMGGAMAARLLSHGYTVAVHDIDPHAEAQAVALGAMACATPLGLAASSDVVIVAVVDGPQCEAVLFGDHGAAAGLARGGTVMLCATIAPGDVESLAQRLQAAGLDWIDAPMSGGPVRAREGHMSLMLAGAPQVLERHRVLLGALSTRLMFVSERAGDGARTKLVNNLLATINLAGTAEVLALAERMGLDMRRTLDVIEQSSGQNWIGSDRMNRALRGDNLPRARTALLAKDSRLALESARDTGMQVPVGAQAAALFDRACKQGLADLDDASLLALLRNC